MHTFVKTHNNKQMEKSVLFLYPAGDPADSPNLIGSKLDQEPFSEFFSERTNR